jgi:hypothetical protein
LFPAGTVDQSVSPRAAGLPGLQHGGGAAAAASARHHHAKSVLLMAGWHDGSTNTNVPRARRLREVLADWWRRIRRS